MGSREFKIFGECWISRSRCNICCSVRAQGSHEKTSVSGLHGFALDQPFINGIGPINRMFLKISVSTRCNFLEGSKVSKGKRLERVGDRTFARQKSSCFVAYVHYVKTCLRPFPTVSDRFHFSERLIGPIPFMKG